MTTNLILKYPNFLNLPFILDLLTLATEKQDKFINSSYINTAEYPDHRFSKILWENHYSELATKFKTRLGDIIEKTNIVGGLTFPTIDVQLTASGHNDQFGWHKDNGSYETASRAFTFVYYFWQEPKVWTGGRLMFKDDATKQICERIEPEMNSLVIFPSCRMHSIERVNIENEKDRGILLNSRFTLNGWLHL